MTSCESSDSTSNPAIGIVLVLIACAFYATGNCLQRYSLLKPEGEKVLGCLHRQVGWFLGAVIYFSANGIYSVALSFAPVSVLAAVFSLTIVANATCARLMLGDKVSMLAIPGYALVLFGSILFSVTVTSPVCHFDGDELVRVMTTNAAAGYWGAIAAIMAWGMFFAYRFEKKYPLEENNDETKSKADYQANPEAALDNFQDENTVGPVEIPPMTRLLARFLYPSALGATEAAGALILKAINSLFTTIATDDPEGEAVEDQDNGNLSLWIGLFGVGIFIFIGIVMWLRLTYTRFEITGAFPVEFGFLTFASVVGGFTVFQDYKFVNGTKEWLGVACAGVCILGGIGVTAYASFRAKLQEEEEQRRLEEAQQQQ